MNYTVLSDDIIRFADKQKLDKFTVLGHSLGGRTAMTVACRYPDRVDSCISVDAAPVDESQNELFNLFTAQVVRHSLLTSRCVARVYESTYLVAVHERRSSEESSRILQPEDAVRRPHRQKHGSKLKR